MIDDAYISNLSHPIMDVDYKNWRSSITVNTSNVRQPLYTLQAGGCSRHVTFTNGANEGIGTSKIHKWTNRIEVEIQNEQGSNVAFEMGNTKWFGGSPCYYSPAFNGELVTWKNKAMSSKILYTLIDGQGVSLAHFQSSPRTQIGRLELANIVTEEVKINEIMVTLLTILYRKVQTIQTSAIVAIT